MNIHEITRRLFVKNNHYFISGNNNIIRLKDIVYFFIDSGVVFAWCEDGSSVALDENFSDLVDLLDGIFIRTHRSCLVCLDRICGVSRRYPKDSEDYEESMRMDELRIPDECELHIEGLSKTIPVTRTYAKKVKDALNIKTFHHLVPDNTEDRRMRALGLIDFGWRDLKRLDINNNAAVEQFIKKWDIKQFDRNTMIRYFRQVGISEIDKRKVIKNIIFQLYRWIKKGIEPLSDGNIRSLWYRIKSVLAYHSNVLEPGDVDVYYDALTEMIEDYGLFKYKDFGFMDMNESYRGIGKTRPEVVLASEKIGHYAFIRQMADKAGCSFICLKGEPAHITLEYFSDDLMEITGNKKKHVFVISDIDPAGFSIESNLVEGLKRHGHKIERVISLVTLNTFTDEEIGYVRYPVVKYEVKDSDYIPIPPASSGQITKARDWFHEFINDERLFTTNMIDNRKICTIWGIESDAADRAKIEKKFFELLG